MDGDVVGLGVMLVGGLVAAWRLITNQQAEAVKVTAAWDAAARRLHANVEGTTSRYGRRVLRGSVDGKVLLIVAETRNRNNGRGQEYVKVRAGTLMNLAALDMDVAKRGILGKIAQKMHVAEVETGDAAFHEELRVTGAPAALARAFLDRMTREHIKDLGEPFTIEGREFVLEREGYPETSEALETMARYAEIMVRRWNVLERAPQRFAAALDFVLAEDRVVLVPGGSVVVATGVRRGREVTMEIHLGDELTTRLRFDGGEVVLAGIECNAIDAGRELDALIDTAPPRQGGYR